jgi:hypothetical protein
MNKENALQLIEDMSSLVNHTYYSWNLKLDKDALYQAYKPKVFLDFLNILYREKQKSENATRYACKENRIFDFAFILLSYFPNAKFIYLFRDPRDYVLSILKSPTGPKTTYSAAKHWENEQKKCHILIETFELDVYKVKYRELVSNTREVMEGLCDFIGEPMDEGCTQVNIEKSENITWNIAWKNLNKPIMSKNYGKFRAEFNNQTINMIETVTKEYMIRLGYTLDTQAHWRQPKYFRYLNFIKARLYRNKYKNKETMQTLLSRNELISTITMKRKQSWEISQLK